MAKTSGSLISKDEARELSRRLCLLGDYGAFLLEQLDGAGYALPVAAVRAAHDELASTESARAQLRAYWREYAKERLAALTGPVDLFKGKFPDVATYRSHLLNSLRTDAAAGKLKSEGAIVSPQIEPTVKRYVEMMPDSEFVLRVWDGIKSARSLAASALGLPEMPEFAGMSAEDRYALLIDRYAATFLENGFSMDSHRKTGVVFRRITSNGRWAFLFVDDSREDVEFGALHTQFAITLPKKAVLPRAVPLTAVSNFTPNDLVPGFRAAQGFAKDSYPEFCLAADASAFLARSVYERVEILLSAPK